MRIFKNLWFTRFANKEGITDEELKIAAADIEAGRVEAELGGGVFKKRIARSGEGKSGGYRVIVYFKIGERLFFIYGFAKSKKDNISEKELRNFKEDAKDDFALTDKQIEVWLKCGTLFEII